MIRRCLYDSKCMWIKKSLTRDKKKRMVEEKRGVNDLDLCSCISMLCSKQHLQQKILSSNQVMYLASLGLFADHFIITTLAIHILSMRNTVLVHSSYCLSCLAYLGKELSSHVSGEQNLAFYMLVSMQKKLCYKSPSCWYYLTW